MSAGTSGPQEFLQGPGRVTDWRGSMRKGEWSGLSPLTLHSAASPSAECRHVVTVLQLNTPEGSCRENSLRGAMTETEVRGSVSGCSRRPTCCWMWFDDDEDPPPSGIRRYNRDLWPPLTKFWTAPVLRLARGQFYSCVCALPQKHAFVVWSSDIEVC